METQERQYVLDHLGASEARLLALTDGLTQEQWDFHESPERWSISENVEHCILVENAIAAGIERALATPAETQKKAAVLPKDPYAKGAGDAAGRKIVAIEALCPVGQWKAREELVTELRRVRARSMAFATETEADLRSHFFPHQVLGDLDCYQWLVIQSQHGERHAKQIERVKCDTRFPQ